MSILTSSWCKNFLWQIWFKKKKKKGFDHLFLIHYPQNAHKTGKMEAQACDPKLLLRPLTAPCLRGHAAILWRGDVNAQQGLRTHMKVAKPSIRCHHNSSGELKTCRDQSQGQQECWAWKLRLHVLLSIALNLSPTSLFFNVYSVKTLFQPFSSDERFKTNNTCSLVSDIKVTLSVGGTDFFFFLKICIWTKCTRYLRITT